MKGWREEKSTWREPIVSVIIPAYNAARYIEKTIQSALSQEIPLEILVVDDCSTDGLQEMLSSRPYWQDIVYLRNEKNMGVAESRNRGVQAAKGRYIAYLDADDWWRRGKLKKQLDIMKKTDAVLSYTGRELADDSGRLLKKRIPVKEKISYPELLYHNIIPCSSVIMKKEAALSYPMRRSDLHEDFLQWLMILKNYGVAYGVNEPLLISRLTAGGKSRKKWKSIRMTYGVYREMGIGRIKSAWYMGWHLMGGVMKYMGKAKADEK